MEKPSTLDKVLDLVDSKVFEYHKNEFELLISDISNPSLNSILLNDKLEVYDDERLYREVLLLLSKYFTEKLNTILYNKTLDFKDKAIKIRVIRDKISQLKQGKAVSYDF